MLLQIWQLQHQLIVAAAPTKIAAAPASTDALAEKADALA